MRIEITETDKLISFAELTTICTCGADIRFFVKDLKSENSKPFLKCEICDREMFVRQATVAFHYYTRRKAKWKRVAKKMLT